MMETKGKWKFGAVECHEEIWGFFMEYIPTGQKKFCSELECVDQESTEKMRQKFMSGVKE